MSAWRRIRAEDGIALPTAMWLMVILVVVAATAAGAAIVSISETQTDRESAKAFALADSAIDVMTYQSNHYMPSEEVQSMLGLGGNPTSDGCVSYSGSVSSAYIESDSSAEFCAEVTVPNLLPGQDAVCYLGITPGLDLSIPGNLTNGQFKRLVVCQGKVEDERRRILARLATQITGGVPATLWRRDAWVECTDEFVSLSAPADGCPALPA